MHARRCEPEDDIAGGDGFSSDSLSSFDGADGEAREIVVAIGVHARHLRGLAADEGAAGLAAAGSDAGDDGCSGRDVEPAAGKVIEEEEGFGALHDEVVDAHGHEVDADGVVPAGRDGDLELGAHAIGRGDEDRIAKAGSLGIEEGAEAAEAGGGAAARRRPRQRLDRLDQRVAGIDIDTGRLVGPAVYGVLPGDAL